MAGLVSLWGELKNADLNGYGAQPIPSSTDVKFQCLARVFSRLDEVERGKVYILSPIPPFALLAFSERMATLAVREHSETVLFLGLIGLVLEGFRHDPRENTLILALHYDAAARIEVDPVKIFAEAALYASDDVARHIIGFAARDPAHRSISSMGYRTIGEGATFKYERTW